MLIVRQWDASWYKIYVNLQASFSKTIKELSKFEYNDFNNSINSYENRRYERKFVEKYPFPYNFYFAF